MPEVLDNTRNALECFRFCWTEFSSEFIRNCYIDLVIWIDLLALLWMYSVSMKGLRGKFQWFRIFFPYIKNGFNDENGSQKNIPSKSSVNHINQNMWIIEIRMSLGLNHEFQFCWYKYSSRESSCWYFPLSFTGGS